MQRSIYNEVLTNNYLLLRLAEADSPKLLLEKLGSYLTN